MPLRRSRIALLLSLAMPIAPLAHAAAQGIEAGCDKAGTTSFRFGLTGGDLMPSATEITAAGTVRTRGQERIGPVIGHVRRASVLALAKHAWRSGFGALPPAPTRPTKNPDAARQFIELHSACGFHHVEYGPGDGSPLFRELYARLKQLTATATGKHG